jgi:hypothetical protein
MPRVLKSSKVIKLPKTKKVTRRRKKKKRRTRIKNPAMRIMVIFIWIVCFREVIKKYLSGSSSDSGAESSASELEKAKPSPKMKP